MLATSKHVFKIKTCRNLFKNYDLLSADSTYQLSIFVNKKHGKQAKSQAPGYSGLSVKMNILLACLAAISFPLFRQRDQACEQANKHALCEQKMGRCGVGLCLFITFPCSFKALCILLQIMKCYAGYGLI